MKKLKFGIINRVFILSLLFINLTVNAQEGQLLVGWAQANITPDKPVALIGQKHKRISQSVKDSLAATVLAIETRGTKGEKEQGIMVSCDLIMIRGQTQQKLQDLISKRIDDFDASKLFLNATHTHTAPGTLENGFLGLYDVSDDEGVMKPSEYEALFLDRVAAAVVRAWKRRQPSGLSWGLGNAVLGHNRRVVKFDGSASMYGANEDDFSHYEGTEDTRVGMLFFWDKNQEISGMVINITCTAQVTGGENFISADFIHEARKAIKQRYGRDLFVFFQIGSAGDITPIIHESIYSRAQRNMLKRKGITARQELAERTLEAVRKVMPYARNDIKKTVVFKHHVAKVDLPTKKPPAQPFYKTDDVKPMEFHVIRLGDVAIATNPFELFLDYGLRIKTRSKPILTLLVQLSCQHSGYLPTERAVEGGGYSAEQYIVGPEGGHKLVDETVKRINKMWSK